MSTAGPFCPSCGRIGDDAWFIWRAERGDAPPNGDAFQRRRCEACGGVVLAFPDAFCAKCGALQSLAKVLSPPSSILRGVVVRLRAEGFDVETSSGSVILVTTMTDGRRLDLRAGEQVSVFGGFDAGHFASGSISAGAPEQPREVRDAPRPRVAKSVLTRVRHWLRGRGGPNHQ